ncbi:MAG TPA: hypothetical protein PLK04_09270 [Bacillota bacterium]|jgi:Holliday junction resolvasome RuvABC endonuclease subunit|nr:hypothetical protein [Bacillota bacterium]HOQ48029.1 hypothetical protein [Bryobacteraceae bacterium]HPZ14414.1 hypothetical protein [Bacillota bacterium]
MGRIYIALDPALRTGVAYRTGELSAFVWDCRGKKGAEYGVRYQLFARYLRGLLKSVDPDGVVYEQAPIARGYDAQRNSYGFEAVLNLVCQEYGVPCFPVHARTLKKWATGNGNATKEEMIRAAVERFGYRPACEPDDNEADAVCLLAYAENECEVTGRD